MNDIVYRVRAPEILMFFYNFVVICFYSKGGFRRCKRQRVAKNKLFCCLRLVQTRVESAELFSLPFDDHHPALLPSISALVSTSKLFWMIIISSTAILISTSLPPSGGSGGVWPKKLKCPETRSRAPAIRCVHAVWR
ncbi:hypothetical protein KP509_32G015500 [Ceratopteris richardii]|uniref:Uncharacterized protein n=1 Tax=Ceratopteris richardii TaxID=49495 RepID=A0A8T2QT24_CERRI|nr:hypothetical protein KP509_32G015500 [Ceratopteris richardii]